MKVLLYSRNGQYPKKIESVVKNAGLEIIANSPNPSNSSNAPDAIITFGGDGTLLGAERDYPGIPKLPLKDSGVGFHTIQKPIEEILKLFSENKLQIKEYFKLELFIEGKKYHALNEIAIRNQLATSALRFAVSTVNREPVSTVNPLIGDGVIISTPFGSTGYFYSISGKSFTSGIGIAYNNIHNSKEKNQFVAENESVSVTILRGPAQITFDNNPETLILKDNETIEIKKSPEVAKIYSLN